MVYSPPLQQRETSVQQLTFITACNQYFKRKPGQSLTDFQHELKALTDEDRKYLASEFTKVGITIVASTN